MESFDGLADEVSSLEHRVADAIFDAIRAQLRSPDDVASKDLEKRLAKVRRSLLKAEALLRGAEES